MTNEVNIQDVVMHGAGNRFLLHFGSTDPMSLMKSHEHLDGALTLSESSGADVLMDICNKDGSIAQQCGNGLRCVALHFVRSRLVEGNQVRIETLAGTSECVVDLSRNEVSVLLPKPIEGKEHCSVTGDAPDCDYVNLGNPNAVLWVDENPMEIRAALGEQLSEHASFQEGMNVHFARRDDEHHATIASWERGVGPTLASGTGGAAVFVTSGAQALRVSSQGGTLFYKYDDDGAIVMTGPANYE